MKKKTKKEDEKAILVISSTPTDAVFDFHGSEELLTAAIVTSLVEGNNPFSRVINDAINVMMKMEDKDIKNIKKNARTKKV